MTLPDIEAYIEQKIPTAPITADLLERRRRACARTRPVTRTRMTKPPTTRATAGRRRKAVRRRARAAARATVAAANAAMAPRAA
jgi:hypothetical protein